MLQWLLVSICVLHWRPSTDGKFWWRCAIPLSCHRVRTSFVVSHKRYRTMIAVRNGTRIILYALRTCDVVVCSWNVPWNFRGALVSWIFPRTLRVENSVLIIKRDRTCPMLRVVCCWNVSSNVPRRKRLFYCAMVCCTTIAVRNSSRIIVLLALGTVPPWKVWQTFRVVMVWSLENVLDFWGVIGKKF